MKIPKDADNEIDAKKMLKRTMAAHRNFIFFLKVCRLYNLKIQNLTELGKNYIAEVKNIGAISECVYDE